MSEHETFVAGEVLATSVAYAPVPEPTLVGTVSDGHEVRVLVTPRRPLTVMPGRPAAHGAAGPAGARRVRSGGEELSGERGLPLASAGVDGELGARR